MAATPKSASPPIAAKSSSLNASAPGESTRDEGVSSVMSRNPRAHNAVRQSPLGCSVMQGVNLFEMRVERQK